MTKGNLVGIIFTIVIFIFILSFIASKITIYDGTQLAGIPTAKSLFDAIFGNFLEWLWPF